MASEKRAEVAGAAWKGADRDRLLAGEDSATVSIDDARRWVSVYGQLADLEQKLFDELAHFAANMPVEARKEAEETNLPVIGSQLERFRHRLAVWTVRLRDLQSADPPTAGPGSAKP